jgi:hypothetical protein
MGVWEYGSAYMNKFKIFKLLWALGLKLIPAKNRRDYIAYDY